MPKVYSIETLYELTTQRLHDAETAVEFQLLLNRQSILMDLINAGIEYTTLEQLYAIH